MDFPILRAAGDGCREDRANMPDDRAYEAGQRALEGHRYSEALEYFNQVAPRARQSRRWRLVLEGVQR